VSGYYIAIVSTTVETENPEKELAPGLNLLGPVKEKFITVDDIFEPTDEAEKKNRSSYQKATMQAPILRQLAMMWLTCTKKLLAKLLTFQR